jgi:FMN phosphatase YigB (HAD superfamily)
MIRNIFLDLDDTLNSLTLHILGTVCNLDIGTHDYHRFPSEVGYDIIAAYEKLKPAGFPEYSVQEFWENVPRIAWSHTPRAPEFDWLLDQSIGLVGPENVCLLTSPTKDPESLAGKLEWIHMNLPSFMHRQYLVGPRKHFCARPDSLLIDDSDENVKKFREHGGHAILVPRPWNSLHGIDTKAHLISEFYFLYSESIA